MNGWRYWSTIISLFFQRTGVLRSENSADVRFSRGNVNFHLCLWSRTLTYKYWFAVRRNNEREQKGETGLRGKQEGKKNMSRVGRARTRRSVTHGTFCPNSARTYFHAARAPHVLSRAYKPTVTNGRPVSRMIPFFFFYLNESCIWHIWYDRSNAQNMILIGITFLSLSPLHGKKRIFVWTRF